MTQVVMDKKEEIVMKLTHFLITKENYTPIVVNGTKNEVWLENQEGPYKIIRINSNYIHNNEQYKFDLFKIRNITAQVKKKTLSFKMNVLNIFLDINDDIKLDDVKNIRSISIKNSKDLLKNETLKETFPKIDSELLQEKNNIDLKPLLSLKSHVVHVKELEPGRIISYGGTFEVEKPMQIATVPVGYADGYPRSLSNQGYVLIHGKRAAICGRVCMDQMMVDVTDIADVCPGDEVTLIGRDGAECITLEELGDLSGRFNYEFVCDLNKRIPRVYVKQK